MLKILDNLEEYVLLVLFPSMVAIVLAATLGRYTQWYAMFWGEEAARYIMVYLGYFGIALAMKRRAHIGVCLLTDKVRRPAGKKVVLFLQTLILIAFCAIISYFVIQLVLKQAAIGQRSPSLGIPMWLAYASVPMGMILLAIRTLQVSYHQWQTIVSVEKE